MRVIAYALTVILIMLGLSLSAHAKTHHRHHVHHAKIAKVHHVKKTRHVRHERSVTVVAIIDHLKHALPPEPLATPVKIVETVVETAALTIEAIHDTLRGPPDPIREAREYLLRTAHPGGTMIALGPRLAIWYLNPDFSVRLAKAVRRARQEGINAGVMSAGRAPALGVGGMRDKAESMHAAGMAVDMAGIGELGSHTARRWYTIAAEEGIIRPYPAAVEWNHMQPTLVKTTSAAGIRRFITAKGPSDFAALWQKQKRLLISVAQAIKFHPVQVAHHATKHRRHA